MTTEEAKQLSENALNRLMAALEQGQSAALKQFLAVMSRFRKYSWTNCLLICTQFPAATLVGGFHFWLKLGRHVRKGEKGIAILAPMVGRKRSSGDEEREQNEQTRVFGFKACHVFDVSQTEGRDLPEFATATGDPQDYLTRLTRFVASQNLTLEYDPRIAPARGMSSGGKITLLPDLSPAETVAILAHEIGHELLHRGERRNQTTHTVRETQAEAVAFVVCSAIGLETNTASSDYVQLHGGDKTTLAESLAAIQQTASVILQPSSQRRLRRQTRNSTNSTTRRIQNATFTEHVYPIAGISRSANRAAR
jgi:antirestriction protein ArdC